MVTDDLIVTPLSSISIVSYLERMKDRSKGGMPVLETSLLSFGHTCILLILLVSDSQLTILFDCMLMQDLRIFKASLTTTSTLTNGLRMLLYKHL
jgi:hypothetical protein